MEIGLGGSLDILRSYRSHRHKGWSISMFWHSRHSLTSQDSEPRQFTCMIIWKKTLRRPTRLWVCDGAMVPFLPNEKNGKMSGHMTTCIHQPLPTLCCECRSAKDACSCLRSPDAALGAALTEMRVVLHTATSELIWANPGRGRFEPSASRQALMKSIKLSTFREHCFTKPLKHTTQQTAELGLSACVESERAMLLFRGLKTTLQSRALIFSFYF